MLTFADKVVVFNRHLTYAGALPEGFEVMNPFLDNPETMKVMGDFYINSPFPLAIIRQTAGGKWLNANYYDDSELFEHVKEFMFDSLKKHINMGLDTSEVFILGKKNADYISKLNAQEKLFDKLTVLEHPRYIQQYRSKEKQLYINKYLQAFLGR
ncbi:MAG: DUF4918 family protein [Proteiniphilum sp.]|nr:DUF4918 family protein [Proteiniphilum sp.]